MAHDALPSGFPRHVSRALSSRWICGLTAAALLLSIAAIVRALLFVVGGHP